MKVLVTGGTGVVGASTVTALLQRGHSVRLLSRHAERDTRQWAQGVTPVQCDIGDAGSIRGAADGCDAVLHLAAIEDESPPEVTFERVNVEGTRHAVREAEHAGVGRLVYVSSLGAERGASAYHRSKRDAEAIVRGFAGEWTIVRPGAVYGPGDQHVSVLLKMMRALPAIPTIGDGDHPFQPVWHEDLAEALAIAVERQDLQGRVLDVAGPDRTSQNDLVQRMREVTGRSVLQVPVPELLTQLGIRAAGAVGVDVPFNDSQMTMLLEGNVLAEGATNALTDVLGVTPTPLSRGLERLAGVQPEQLPSAGMGSLERKRYWADIRGGRMSGDELFEYVRTHFGALWPSFVETGPEPVDGTPGRMDEGETLTLSLPLRGHVQVRVAEVAARRITLLTLEGHPLAGAVRFLVEERGDAIRFEVQVYERAANVLDFVAMRTVGGVLQDMTWNAMVQNVVRATGGHADETHRTSDALSEAEAELVERWVEELALARRRDEAGV